MDIRCLQAYIYMCLHMHIDDIFLLVCDSCCRAIIHICMYIYMYIYNKRDMNIPE
jgi:hypothetical protein